MIYMLCDGIMIMIKNGWYLTLNEQKKLDKLLIGENYLNYLKNNGN